MPRRRSSSSGASPRTPKRLRRDLESDRTLRDAAFGENNNGRRRVLTREAFFDMADALKSIEDEGSELRIHSLDLQIDENRKAHRTSEYEHKNLIIRRGQIFNIKLVFDREYDNERDTIFLQLSIGSRPQESKGTIVRIPLLLRSGDQPKLFEEEWSAYIKSQDGKSLVASVAPPAEAIIGRYSLHIETVCTDGDGKQFRYRREFDDPIICLFNAWNKADDVYMEDEDERQEYVLNESGRLWQGTARSYSAFPWNIGQFEDVSLDAALYLLDRAELPAPARSNPVRVIRVISAMANSNDDNGVLTGRWTDTYPKDSTEPWAWTGSVAILEQFMKRKKAVRFGQCWVFSGIVTTLLRALGLPTRSVTNFESAHDTDSSMTIDYHWDEDGAPLEDYNDSVWNFHVWNESFCRRKDLPEGYDGWQAHDATPQEVSEGVMRCGPCPIKAIKEGHVHMPVDTPFIFAEVNGDKVHWEVKKDGSMEPIYVETSVIGANISTKAVGNNGRNDLTSEYKYREGSEEERKVVKHAFQYSSRKDHRIYDIKEPDVTFNLDTPTAAQIGKGFEIKVNLKNKSDQARTAIARLTLTMSFYTGVPGERLLTKLINTELKPNDDAVEVLKVDPDDYVGVMKPEATMQVYLNGHVEETKRAYAHMDSISLVKPQIKLEHPERVTIREDFTLKMSLINPLSEKLSGGEFHIEAPGITKGTVVHHNKKIPPGGLIEEEVTLQATRSGTKEIVVRFTSDYLSGLTGTGEIYVSYSA